MLLGAILALPSNYSDMLRGERQIQAAPRLVRQAEQFLEAHARKPITISDVVAECGCSRRTLFNAFRQHRGYTPMQFLAETRLKVARYALLGSSPTDTVASIAAACGFSHLGRFAEAYCKRFGEKPSDTMRQA
jgi:transcriptional regulator GlxA family with amidase domain